MPVSANPKATCDFWLEEDADEAPESRLTFTCRFLTRGQAELVNQLCDQAEAEEDDAKCFDLLWQALSVGIVGWKNAVSSVDGSPVPDFSRETIGNVLSNHEIWLLARRYPSYVSLKEVERFLSRSRSRTKGEGSAPAATSTSEPPAKMSPAPAAAT